MYLRISKNVLNKGYPKIELWIFNIQHDFWKNVFKDIKNVFKDIQKCIYGYSKMNYGYPKIDFLF